MKHTKKVRRAVFALVGIGVAIVAVFICLELFFSHEGDSDHGRLKVESPDISNGASSSQEDPSLLIDENVLADRDASARELIDSKRQEMFDNATAGRAIARKRQLDLLPEVKDNARLLFKEDSDVDFSRAFPLDREKNLWIAKVHIEDLRKLLFDPSLTRFPSVRGIYIVDAKEGTRQLLLQSTDEIRYGLLGVSPDKRYALVSRGNRRDGTSIWCMVDIETREELPLKGTENANGEVSWDESGNMYFSTMVPGQSSALYRTSLSSNEPQLLLEASVSQRRGVVSPVPTPDGKDIYYCAISENKDERKKRWLKSIYKLDLSTNESERVCDGEDPVFVPGINGLVHVKWPKGSGREIHLYDLSSGASTQLTYGSAFSPVVDSGKLYFTSTRQYGHTNIFELELVSGEK